MQGMQVGRSRGAINVVHYGFYEILDTNWVVPAEGTMRGRIMSTMRPIVYHHATFV
jgi:hypothetical protein